MDNLLIGTAVAVVLQALAWAYHAGSVTAKVNQSSRDIQEIFKKLDKLPEKLNDTFIRRTECDHCKGE